MGDIERAKVAVIEAATAWADAIQRYGPEAARPDRDKFARALDDAFLTATRGAVEAERKRIEDRLLARAAATPDPDLRREREKAVEFLRGWPLDGGR